MDSGDGGAAVPGRRRLRGHHPGQLGGGRPMRARRQGVGRRQHEIGDPASTLAQRANLLLLDDPIAEVEDRPQAAVEVALDLPDAELLIQMSGTFGSRQEEAQRLGRVLRPKPGGRTAYFYTLVSRDTREIDFAHNRQLFLAEQGYDYQIADADSL